MILKENGIEVSIATFKRYLDDRGFSKKRNKKSIISKPKNTIYNLIRFNNDTFLEEIGDDDTFVSSDRMFREIIGKIHSREEFRKKWAV